jgi:hypothetical protein
MSIFGIRTAHTKADTQEAARLTGGSGGRHLLAVITSLLVHRQAAPARKRPQLPDQAPRSYRA